MKVKKILVPVDFSENSINALKYAAAMSTDPGVGIFILHVADPESLEPVLHGNLSPEHMFDLINKEDYMSDIKTTFIEKNGPVSKTILNESKVLDIDLVVMGTQGAGNFTKNLIGTNTSAVIGNSDCPVLAVPSEAIFKPVRKVVFAIDITQKEEKIIAELVEYFSKMNTSILLTYVTNKNYQESESALNKITKNVKDKTGYSRLASKLIDSDDFHEAIENFALDIEADLLVMITHHRGVIEALFDPSLTKKFAFHTEIPLFAVSHKRSPVIFFGVPL